MMKKAVNHKPLIITHSVDAADRKTSRFAMVHIGTTTLTMKNNNDFPTIPKRRPKNIWTRFNISLQREILSTNQWEQLLKIQNGRLSPYPALSYLNCQ